MDGGPLFKVGGVDYFYALKKSSTLDFLVIQSCLMLANGSKMYIVSAMNSEFYIG